MPRRNLHKIRNLREEIEEYHSGASIIYARITVVAILLEDGRIAARISFSTADAAPIIIAIEHQRGGNFNFGQECVALAIKEIEGVVVAGNQEGKIVHVKRSTFCSM